MREMEKQKLMAFFEQTDADGCTNAEKAINRAKVIRRISSTDKSHSFENSDTTLDPILPGVVEADGKVIGLGIHIYNEDVYPLQSFEIYLRGCGLCGELDLTESQDMVFLDLYNNQIDAVKLGNMPNMRILGLQNNAVSFLDPAGLPVCQGIDIGKNQLKTLDVSQNHALVELYVNDNQLKKIDLSLNAKLKYFYCHNNQITQLDTRANPLLRHLNATGNPMIEIRSLAPQREEPLPLELYAEAGGYVGLKFNPIYTAQWKETGLWEQSYTATPLPGWSFSGWYNEKNVRESAEPIWTEAYGTSRVLTARFAKE